MLFYATRTPLCDDERRVILGAALLRKKHDLTEYTYKPGSKARIRAMVWERPIQHSLRPSRKSGGFTDGFVMPYHALLAAWENKPDKNIYDFIAFAPEDSRIQFSYGTEHVAHGAAAAALLAARNALERTAKIVDGPWERYIGWIDERLGRLWKLQGPAPGLGVVLSALHKGFNGTLFAMALSDTLKENADPWPVINDIFAGRRNAPAGSPPVTNMFRKRWDRIRARPAQLDRLKLLARLELTAEQTQRAIAMDAAAVLSNPFVLFENDRTSYEPISFGVVDRGLYPGREVSTAHKLPKSCSAELAEYDNPHRLRAACMKILEDSTESGHTFMPVERVTEVADRLPVVHKIPLDAETVDICRDDFAPPISVVGAGKDMTLQLDRYVTIGSLLKAAVDSRLKNPPKPIRTDWRKVIDRKFGGMNAADSDEVRARTEKTAALDRLANNRIVALMGPAGTGKTTVLELLLAKYDIVGTRVRLLAPTGKARVKLGQETGQHGNVQTVAQFLLGDRFDPDTGRYFINTEAPEIEATTCIIDESSMLTEDMLAAIVDALPASCRLILVGDPYQLPPIGAGCPFVDIIEYLKREHGGNGVAELNTPRRQELTQNCMIETGIGQRQAECILPVDSPAHRVSGLPIGQAFHVLQHGR